jgi:hypothetical protein
MSNMLINTIRQKTSGIFQEWNICKGPWYRDWFTDLDQRDSRRLQTWTLGVTGNQWQPITTISTRFYIPVSYHSVHDRTALTWLPIPTLLWIQEWKFFQTGTVWGHFCTIMVSKHVLLWISSFCHLDSEMHALDDIHTSRVSVCSLDIHCLKITVDQISLQLPEKPLEGL